MTLIEFKRYYKILYVNLFYRKGTSRPSFDKDEDVNHHDPSSSEITEGSSKEGTMESTDEVGVTFNKGSSKL